MKKISAFALLTAVLALLLIGCSQRNEPLSDFSVNNWSSSIGAVDGNDVDNFEQFSYTLFLTSETGKLLKVESVEPIFLDNVLDRIVSNSPPLLFLYYMGNDYGYIRIEGSIVFDISGLTKEQIIHELDPFITAVKIITEDGNEYIVELQIRQREI